jgi:hypothetical protein
MRLTGPYGLRQLLLGQAAAHAKICQAAKPVAQAVGKAHSSSRYAGAPHRIPLESINVLIYIGEVVGSRNIQGPIDLTPRQHDR